MTERRPDDDSGRALARAVADDRHGSPAQRGATVLLDGVARAALAVGRAARSAARRLRSSSSSPPLG